VDPVNIPRSHVFGNHDVVLHPCLGLGRSLLPLGPSPETTLYAFLFYPMRAIFPAISVSFICSPSRSYVLLNNPFSNAPMRETKFHADTKIG
jgi:hypothetical protein